MAAYNTFTINSASPTTALLTQLDTILLANGWTFVETYTNSNDITAIYKSPGASNAIGQDFYIALERTAVTSSLYVSVFEQWDATNKKLIYYAPGSTAAAATAPDGTYRHGDAVGSLPSQTSQRQYQIAVATSTLRTYYIHCTVDRMIWGVKETASQGYVGAFDSFLGSTLDPYPLIVTDFAGSQTASTLGGRTTRDPLVSAVANANNFGICFGSTTTPAASNTGHALYPNIVSTGNMQIVGGDVYRGSNAVAAKIWFWGFRGGVGPVSPRGTLKSVLACASGATQGDTITIGSDVYILPALISTTFYKFFMPTF